MSAEKQKEVIPWESVPNRNQMLKLVMNALDVPEVKKARFVCKDWRDVATQNLLPRVWLVVPWSYYIDEYGECTGDEEQDDDLEVFKKLPLFSQPPKWLIPNVKVIQEYGRYLCRDDSEILTNLRVLGPQVRHLMYGSEEDNLKKLLLACPNLETFKAFNDKNKYNDSDRFPLYDAFLKVIHENGKCHTVTDFHFIPRSFDESSLKTLDTVDWASLDRLKQLSICLAFVMDKSSLWERVRVALTKLLEARKETLETLVIQCPMSFLCGTGGQGAGNQGQGHQFIIPPLNKLKTLELAFQCKNVGTFKSLPRKSIFPTTTPAAFASFPNLRKLIILPELEDKDGKKVEDPARVWDLYLPSFATTLPILSLVRLEIFASHAVLFSTLLFTVFPNVKQLKLHRVRDLAALAKNFLWTNSHLQKKIKVLELEILHRGKDTDFPNFDAILTGLPIKTVKDLKKSLEVSKGDTEKAVRLIQGVKRNKPSLLSLEGLEKFHMTFYGNPCGTNKKPPLILSRVAGELAFKLIPNLKVDILYKDESEVINQRRFQPALADIEPYANVKIVTARSKK